MANLTGLRSNFPNQIDVIPELYDLPINKRTQAQRYQELKTKTTLTPAEVSELNSLTTELQDFIVTPETWNKFGDVVISTQKFFVENTVGFVENKQTEMNSYVDLKKTEMQTEIDKFNDRGVYSPSIQYFKNNFVTFNDGTSNQTYLCLQDCVNKEPSSNPLFWRKLTIQGATGAKGDSGANFVFKGTWNNTAIFMKDEAVRFGGMLFVSKIDNNLDNSPSLTADTNYWFRAMDITITVRKMVGTRNVASQTSTVNFITGEISSFNPTVDSLDVYMNSVRLTRGFDYNINPNNQAIDKINGTWNGSIETPVFFEFVVTKNVINDIIFKDGSALSDGTVTRNKLDVDTQAEINKIAGIDYDLGTFENVIDRYVPLETTAQTVIPAINEINAGLSETNTQMAQKANTQDLINHKTGTTEHSNATNLMKTSGNQLLSEGILEVSRVSASNHIKMTRTVTSEGSVFLGGSSNGLEVRTDIGVGLTVTQAGSVFLGAINASPSITKGSGSPEGIVTARVGSLFLRENGGTNTTLYVKESGTGNTGWVAK